MSIDANVSAITQPAPRRGWLTFSLRGLLLFSLFAALIVSHGSTSYKFQRERQQNKQTAQALQQEIDTLRQELGYFRVQDPDQVHVLQLPQIESGHYAWRVYLPKGTKWRLKMEAKHAAEEGGSSSTTSTSHLDAGEFVMHTKIYRTEDGSWKIGMMLPGNSSTTGLQPKTAFSAASYRMTAGNVGASLERFDKSKPVKLLGLVCEAPANDQEKPKIRDEIMLTVLPEPDPAAPATAPAPSAEPAEPSAAAESGEE